jgi:hemerythrin
MNVSRWDTNVATGHAMMDAEHQVELALLAEVRAAMHERGDRALAIDILRQLIDHTNVHFSSEQMLMRLTAFPDFQAHQLEHDELMRQAHTLLAHVESGEIEPTVRFIDAMTTWLTDHMVQKDRPLARFLERKPPMA